ARLLLIGTYRPVEVVLSGHPLRAAKQELQSRGLCQELPLGSITEAALEEYLKWRFPNNQFQPSLAQVVYQRTEGSPLFMVNVLDYAVAEGLIAQVDSRWQLTVEIDKLDLGVPESIRQMVEKQIHRLSERECRVLVAASVSVAGFSISAVAAALQESAAAVEEPCEGLARRHVFIRESGASRLPDGSVAARYSFVHALYQNALYDRVSAARRAHFHQRVGEQAETAYGERAGEIAAELAMHFENAGDPYRTVKYLILAAQNAAARFANKEVIALCGRGLEQIKHLPNKA